MIDSMQEARGQSLASFHSFCYPGCAIRQTGREFGKHRLRVHLCRFVVLRSENLFNPRNRRNLRISPVLALGLLATIVVLTLAGTDRQPQLGTLFWVTLGYLLYELLAQRLRGPESTLGGNGSERKARDWLRGIIVVAAGQRSLP